MTGQRTAARQLVEVRWHLVADPAALAALAAIVIDTVSPVDATTGHPADQPPDRPVAEPH